MAGSDSRPLSDPAFDVCRPTFLLLAGLFSVVAAVAVLASRGLVADGAYYFVMILEHPWPTTFERGRVAAHVLVQWPLVLGVHLGLTDLNLLRLLHSAGLIYLGPVSLVLCWWMVPREHQRDLLWPLLSLSAGSLNAWFVAVTEAHVLTWLFWPLALFLIHGRMQSRAKTGVACLLALASVAAYETMAMQGLVLTGLAGLRRARSEGPERWAWTTFGGWFLVGVGVGAYFAIHPRSPQNRGAFAVGFRRFAGTGLDDLNYPVLLSFVVLALVAWVFLLGPLRHRMYQSLLGTLTAVGMLVAMWPLFRPEALRPVQQFQARAWIGLLPVILAIGLLAARRRPPSLAAFRMALAFVLVLGVTQLGWHLMATAQWRGYTRIFREEVSHRNGFVPFESSTLAQPRIGIQALRNLTWNYTNPVLSIVLAPSGQVSAIIGVPKGARQPFDPTDQAALPKLARYGVDYSRYLRALAGSS